MRKGFLLIIILMFVALAFAPAYAARDKDTLVIVQGTDPTTLDPHNHMETPAWNILLNLFDSLLQERLPRAARDELVLIEPNPYAPFGKQGRQGADGGLVLAVVRKEHIKSRCLCGLILHIVEYTGIGCLGRAFFIAFSIIETSCIVLT